MFVADQARSKIAPSLEIDGNIAAAEYSLAYASNFMTRARHLHNHADELLSRQRNPRPIKTR